MHVYKYNQSIPNNKATVSTVRQFSSDKVAENPIGNCCDNISD